MGRHYAGLLVAAAANPGGGGQRDGYRRQEAPRSCVCPPTRRQRSLFRWPTHIRALETSICAALMGLGWELGTLIATFAMAGDLFSSFVKRRAARDFLS